MRPRPVPTLAPVEGLLAGTAERDLTPPPGMPKAGYSANANTGNGFQTRIRARVVHLRSGRSSLALVQCDLLGGSSVLQHLVAEAVADRTDIPLAGIWIGATHTHAGPGQFLGTDFYNRHASNQGGFDPAWADFLVRRIADAVIEAHDTRAPALAAFGSTEVWGLTRNRSHDPYVQNRTVTDKRRDPQRKWVAVNPLLHLLRVDRLMADGTTEPMAASIVFSIHGTGISQKAHEYNADVWAYLVGTAADDIAARHGVRPLVGAMEGTHADVAPALRPGLAGHREARRIGAGIGAEAGALHERLGAELSADIALDAGFRELDLDRESDRSIDGIELPDRPAVGAALVAGAHENLTPVIHRIPPFRAGSPKRWGKRGNQAEKWVLGSRWLQPIVTPKRGFPRIIPMQVFRIGGTVLVGLPFEITVESGRRIGAAVAVALAGNDHVADAEVVVSSVANEYSGYVATDEEYRRQFYEGGHTLYGPLTQSFIAAQAARLAAATVGAGFFADVGVERRWDLATTRYLVSAPTEAAPDRAFEGKATFTDPTGTVDGAWTQHWIDVAPGGLAWHEPLVRVEASDDGGSTWLPEADDQGWSLEIAESGGSSDRGMGASGPTGSGCRYRVRWYDPNHRAGRRHRFVLVANNGRPEVAGPAFD